MKMHYNYNYITMVVEKGSKERKKMRKN